MEFVFSMIIAICLLAVFLTVINIITFFAEVPKQLKRIADELEKRGADNG